MKIIDIVLLILLAFGGYQGFKRGLLVEIITIIGFIIALLSAFKLLNSGMEVLSTYIKSEKALIVASFLIIFSLVYFLIYLFGRKLKEIFDYSILGSFDNAAGGLSGMVKMAFGISAVLWIFKATKVDQSFPEYFQDTFVYSYLVDFAPLLVKWVSVVIPFQDIFQILKEQLKDLI